MTSNKHRVQLPDGPVEAEDHGYLDPDEETMTPDEIAATVADVHLVPGTPQSRRGGSRTGQAPPRPPVPRRGYRPAGSDYG